MKNRISRILLAFLMVLSLLGISIPASEADAAGPTLCQPGRGFDKRYREGEWHNYVWFRIDPSYARVGRNWTVSGPYSPGLWANPNSNGYAEAGFRWLGSLPVVGISPGNFSLCWQMP